MRMICVVADMENLSLFDLLNQAEGQCQSVFCRQPGQALVPTERARLDMQQ